LETLKESRFPACPEEIGTQGNLLQLILITPGAFTGGWCPTWLDQSDNHGWVIIPETALKIRLRSAVVDRWQPVSGWNLKLKGERNQGSPKHFRKAVGSGSIYLVETEPGKSAQIAQQLWGKSLCEEIQDRRDGFGICLVGNVNETNSLAKGEHP
jgi:CRISPR-associated protein Cmr3